jgi:putative intracellular protease/amidase
MRKNKFTIQKITSSLLLLLWLVLNNAVASPPESIKPAYGERVLIVVSSHENGFWLPEVLEPYQLLAEAGFKIDIASPKGGKGAARGRLSKQQLLWLERSPLKAQLQQSIPLSALMSKNYRAIYFAGGAGPMFDLVDNAAANKMTREIYEAGGVVAADCHGPAALLNVRLSDGERLIADKAVTGKANIEEGSWARRNYPFLLEDKLTEFAGTYSAKAKRQVHVVVDQRVVTGQNPASAAPMAKALISQLKKLKG